MKEFVLNNPVNSSNELTQEQYKKLPKEKKSLYWQQGPDKYLLIETMSDEYLQNAKYHAQRKELFFHNRMCIFGEAIDIIDETARKRNIALKDFESDFHKNRRFSKDTPYEKR